MRLIPTCECNGCPVRGLKVSARLRDSRAERDLFISGLWDFELPELPI